MKREMENPLILGIFEDEDDILEAVKATRAAGYQIHDVYTPYAVHGIEEAMGLKRSPLTWVCLGFALFGFTLALFVQFWIGSIDWPLNVGGRPFNSLPAYLPVMFELTVLIGGLGVVFSMLVVTRLFPGKRANVIDPEVTNRRFVIALEQKDSSFSLEEVESLWTACNVRELKRQEVGL